jgi:hypothetical protein
MPVGEKPAESLCIYSIKLIQTSISPLSLMSEINFIRYESFRPRLHASVAESMLISTLKAHTYRGGGGA